ncbi:MAG: hypothetical protein H0T79_21550, partial [Deltaproteobacteria bacterium]|nr:hypothetical protein [Deltaproteobacteria bacterium]
SGDVLAQLRTLTVVQRQTYRKDPEFLRRLMSTVTQPIKNKLCFLALLSDEAPGEDHIGRLWEISTEVFGGDHKAQVASLSAGEYARLRADPDMLARVTQPLPPELQKTVRELAGLDTAKAALSIGAHEVPGPKGADGKDVVGPDGKPKSSELYTLGDKVPGQITKAEVDRLGFLKLSTIQRLQLGAAKSWEALLRQAVEVYKLDLKPSLQAPAPSAEPPAPGATPAGPDAAALAKASKEHEHATRAAIWAAVKDVVLPVAKDGKAPQEGAKYGNESAIEHAVMKDPDGDPSSLLFNFSIGAVWNDHDDIDKTIKGASDDIVLNQWSSVSQQKFFGSGGESFKYRYDALKLARSEQAQQAQGTPNPAAKKKLDDETLKFQRYVIEPSQFFEKMLLPGAGGDTKQTDHAGQALERKSENYSKYRKAMNERIKALDQGMVATTIGATGADAQMVGSALRGALQNFSITQEGYADARRDGHGWAGQDEGRELDRAFGDYKQEVNKAEDGTVGSDQKTGAAKDLSPEEARKLAGLDQRVNDRKEDFTTARNEAANIAATVVSVLIGVLLTALLPGAGSLVAMAMYGALVGAAAATGEVITKAAIMGASNYDITDQGARTILTGAATGMIAAGSQFYAGKLMNGLAKAGTVAAQGENLVGAAAAKVPRWQQVLAAGGKAGT